MGTSQVFAQACLWPNVDSINNKPSVRLLPDGHRVEVSYTYTNFIPEDLGETYNHDFWGKIWRYWEDFLISKVSAVTFPKINHVRSERVGFIGDSGIQTGEQFNNHGISFDKNPPYEALKETLLYYQVEVDNGVAKAPSDTTAVKIPKVDGVGGGGSCLDQGLPILKSARVISADATSIDFELTYTVTTSNACGCELLGCPLGTNPQFLEIQRGTSAPGFIPWNMGAGTCTKTADLCGGSPKCIESTYKATYKIGLSPETLGIFTIRTYSPDRCISTAKIGETTFSGSTTFGSAPIPVSFTPNASAGKTVSDLPYTLLNWSPISLGQIAKVYRDFIRFRGVNLGLGVESILGNSITSTIIDDLASVPAGTYYYGADLYQPGWCDSAFSGQTKFDWAGYTPPPCSLTSAAWSTSTATAGDSVTLTVQGSSSCVGKQVNFEVRENDSILEGGIDEPAKIQPATATFGASGVAQASWIAEWQNDCAGLCNPPEYFFNATSEGITKRSADPLLVVFERPSTPPPPPPGPPPPPPSGPPPPPPGDISGAGGCFPALEGGGIDIGKCFGFGNILTLGQGTIKLVPSIFSIASILVLLYFLYGAFKYLKAGGNKEDIAEARAIIIHAIIGFLLLVLAFIVLQFILSGLFGLTEFRVIQ